MAITNETKFRPVVGTEEKILLAPQSPGHVYFAKDSGKIFLDVDEEKRIVMGGSGVSLFYGTAAKVEQNVYGTYPISLEDIDSEDVPKEGDLILNADGGFYKVVEINGTTLLCTIIAVSGTGGGGGGTSGGGGDTPQSAMTTKVTGVTSFSNWIIGKSKNIKTVISSPEDTVVAISYTVKNTYGDNSISKTYGPYPLSSSTGEFVHEFDLGSKIGLGVSSLYIYISGDEGGNKTISYNTLNGVIMDIKESVNFNNKGVFNGNIDFRCSVLGEGIGRTLSVYIDNNLYTSLDVTNQKDNSEISIPITAQSHGTHELVAVLSENDGTNEASLYYQIGCIEANNSEPVIWLGEYPKSIINYEVLNIPYMVYNPNDPDRAAVELFLNGNILASGSQTLAYDRTKWYNWRVIGYVVGNNTMAITCGGTSMNFSVEVAPDTSRDLDIIKSGLILNLNAEGRTNNENVTSRSNWESHIGSTDSKVEFNNFNWYNNGWHTDDDGETCLRISNGASIKIPLNVMNQNKLSNSYVFEFVFKLRNLQRYTTLIKTEVKTDVNGENAKVIKTVSSNDGVWLNYYNDNRGFCLGTQEAYFKSNDVTVSCKYKEDELIHLSFVVEDANVSSVPLMYVYLNGLMTNVATYNPDTDNFNTSSALNVISINSDYCDVDLYKVRVYNTNLTHSNIVHNYVSDYKDVELYDVNNNIVEYDAKGNPNINYEAMVEYNRTHQDNLLMPYMVIETTDVNNTLPYKKANDTKEDPAWTVNLKFVNPELDRAFELGEITAEQYDHGTPSFEATGVNLNVQGTSSQGYPRRNYKSKLKSATSWVYTAGPKAGESFPTKTKDGKTTFTGMYMDGNILTNKFTWKADYMESSGSCNGGLASFLQSVYSKHPVQDYGVSEDVAKNLRTTVYGFPMMVFHKKSGGLGGGKYEFIGRYCLLLDKGCDDNFGFTVDGTSKVVDKIDAETGEKTYKSFKKASECWQIEDNTGGRCSFKSYNLDETRTDDSGRSILTITDDFSYRYHPDGDDMDDAMDRLNDYSSDEAANTFLMSKYTRLVELLKWVSSTDVSANASVPMGGELEEPVTYGSETFTHDTREYRLAKFRNEFDLHFDREYTFTYFIITELLLCYDSRGKNMMIATWGPHEEGGFDIWYPIFYDMDTQLGINNSGVPYWDYFEEATNNGTFSTNDSVLWNNLWTCFEAEIKAKYDGLRTNKLTVSELDGYYRFDPLVSKAYSMKGQRPLIMENVDEYYKYIDCTNRGGGFVDTTGKGGVYTDGYLYCLQGDRKLQRSLFLRNRFNYLDSQWVAGDYALAAIKNYQQRIGANKGFDSDGVPVTSDKYVNCELTQDQIDLGYVRVDGPKANHLDAEWDFKLTPYLKQYINMYVDDTPLVPQKANDGETKEIDLYNIEKHRVTLDSTIGKEQQLVYFPGIEYLSSLGDLSLKYFDKIDLAKATHLKDLLLGSDKEGYFNNNMLADGFKPADQAKTSDGKTNPNAKTMLEKVVISNMGQLSGTYDFSGSEKIKEFRAVGTNIQSVVFADGVQLEKLYLPKTITTLTLKEPTSLVGYATANGVLNAETHDREFSNGIYLEGITDVDEILPNTVTSMNSIMILGGNMGYNSYKITDKVVNIKLSMAEHWDDKENDEYIIDKSNYSRGLTIRLEDVKWSPYRLVVYGEDVIVGARYAKKTSHYTFEPYTPGSSWDVDTKNGRIYQYTPSEDENAITDLSLLDKFLESYESEDNFIQNTTQFEDGRNTLAYLSGMIYVNNKDGVAISESDIRNKYLEAWPELSIYVAKAGASYSAEFVMINENGVETEYDMQKINSDLVGATPHNPGIPSRANYDFKGWEDEQGNRVPYELDEEGNMVFDFSSYIFDNSHLDYKFVAIFEYTYKTIHFVVDGESFDYKIQYPQVLHEPDKSEFVPYKNDAGLDDDKTYVFMGWSSTEDGKNIVDLSNFFATKNYTFYAVFEEKSVYEMATDLDCFDIVDFKYFIKEYDSEYTDANNCLEGYGIRVKDGVTLKGKVTLPTKYNGKDILNIEGVGFYNQKEITHVYWQREDINKQDTKCVSIGMSSQSGTVLGTSFEGCEKLRIFEMPQHIRIISNYSFTGCKELIIPNFENFNELLVIGNSAYNLQSSNQVEKLRNMNKIVIPPSVVRIGATAFMMCNIGKLDLLQFGKPGQPIKFKSGMLGDSLTRNYVFCFDTNSLANQYIENVRIYYDNSDGKGPEQWMELGQNFLINGILSFDGSRGGSYEIVGAYSSEV